MSQELFTELLGSMLRQPARRCLRQRAFVPAQLPRFVSNDTGPSGSQKTRIPPPSSKPSPLGSSVPLHIGLDRNPEALSTISRIPIPKGERGEKFTPSVLARPLGLPYPPQPGQNSPVDTRSWSERKADFTSYEKAIERRRLLARSYLRPYFQEWKRMDYHKGKNFVSNERLFRKDKALYFPNMWGQTLSKSGDGQDGGRNTTSALSGKISIVGIQSGQWAEEQVGTFIGKQQNPDLQNLIDASGGAVQLVHVNVQDQWFKAMLVKLFKGRIRKSIPESEWSRYFLVRLARDVGRGLTEDIRDAMGFLNSQVGYVYLLDTECRIRWAGSGHAWKGEVDSLNAGVRRLLEEATSSKRATKPAVVKVPSREPPPRGVELEKKTELAEAAAA